MSGIFQGEVAIGGGAGSNPEFYVSKPMAHVAVMAIDRPPVNAFDVAAYEAATQAFVGVDADPGIRAVVFIGAGQRAFCAGSDRSAFEDPDAARQVLSASTRFFEAFDACGVPVISALNGPAVGAGAMIAAASDVVIAAPHAYLAIPEVEIGIVGGASHLLMSVPPAKVSRMLLLGERLTSQEALRLGIVAEIVEPDGLLASATRIAAKMAALDPDAVREGRHVLRDARRRATMAGFRAELAAVERLRARKC
jgi:enoyl-CoA hydratase